MFTGGLIFAHTGQLSLPNAGPKKVRQALDFPQAEDLFQRCVYSSSMLGREYPRAFG